MIGTKFILNFSYANYYKKFWYKKRFALCKRNIENVNSKVLNTRNGRTILISKCAACKSQGQEAKRLLSSVCLKTPLSKLSNILLLGKMLLKYCSNPNLGVWGGGGGGVILLPGGFLLITQKRFSRYWANLKWGCFWFPDFWSIFYKRKLSWL